MAVSSDVTAAIEPPGSRSKNASTGVPSSVVIVANTNKDGTSDSQNTTSTSGNRTNIIRDPEPPNSMIHEKESTNGNNSIASTSNSTSKPNDATIDGSPIMTSLPKRQMRKEGDFAHDAIDDPLPSARELSRVLCRIVDTEVYSEYDSEIALLKLKHWASKQNASFGNHLADIGGLQQVLFFIEDNMKDCTCVDPALMLMETLCKPLQEASHNMYESKTLSTMRTKIGKCIVDVNGVDLMLEVFEKHALEEENGSENERSTENSDDEGKSSSIIDAVSNSCGLFCYRKADENDDRQLEELRISQRLNTARHSLEVLVLLIPHAIGVHKDAPTKILETLCQGVSILMKNHEIQSSKGFRALIAAVMTCLVATSAIASKDTLAGPKLQRAKTVVYITNLVMRNFPDHQGINRDGCFLFQRICRHLPKSERKRLGVVASLGSILASESIDQDIKEIADEILEEQFK